MHQLGSKTFRTTTRIEGGGPKKKCVFSVFGAELAHNPATNSTLHANLLLHHGDVQAAPSPPLAPASADTSTTPYAADAHAAAPRVTPPRVRALW